MHASRIVTGLDLGTTKIAVVIAEHDDSEDLSVLGIGESPSHGLRGGNLVDLEATVEAIGAAVEQAEQMAGLSVRGVYAGIAGDHIRSTSSRGVIAVSGRENEVSCEDVRRVVDAARTVAIPSNRDILHVIPQGFVVDDQAGIRDPVGMSGVRLEAEVHIVTASSTAVRNVGKVITRAGYKVEGIVAEPMASAWSVLEEDERRLGVILLDIGAGTTDVVVYFDNHVQHVAVITMGGAQITNDIAIGLRTPLDAAEQIKLSQGCAIGSLLRRDEAIEIPGVGGRIARQVSRHVLAAIIEPRMEEILTLARAEVERLQGMEILAAGIVLTGGTAALQGAAEMAEQVFEMPARIGVPLGVGGMGDLAVDPRFTTCIGLA
ncbi:MAG: cell division protein FtsA, partial [Candidatus Eisenbacteria sp.]|nr:cell division protein FtsA [Candidatus Eisenbacteria bacterium]